MPMFPLGTVLLPGALLPLHVFEERYRRLVDDCLAGDGELGVCLIERGSEVGGGDQRLAVGTVARVVDARRFEDGRWALVTAGVRRVRVRRWLEDAPYPRAEVEDWPDVEAGPGFAEARDAVLAALRRLLALTVELGEPVAPAPDALGDDPALASYRAAALAPIGPLDRQALLEAAGPDDRVALLSRLVDEATDDAARRLALDAEGDEPWPPHGT